MENNTQRGIFDWIYLTGFFAILALPLLNFSPIFYPTDFGRIIVFRIIITFVLLIFFWQFLYQRGLLQLPPVKKNALFWLLIALFTTLSLATIFSTDSHFSLFGSPARSGGLINFSFYIIFSLLAFILLKKENWQKIWDVSFIIGGLVSLVGIVQFYQSGARPSATVGNPIFLAMYLSMLFFISLGFLLKESNQTKKLFYGVCMASFVGGIIVANTRAVFLGMLIAGIFFVVVYNKKFLTLKLLILAVTIIGGIAVIASGNNPIAQRISWKALVSDQRPEAWHIALKAFKAKPILGWGPENFETAFNQFYDPVTVPYVPYTPFGNWWDRAHNSILDMGVQAGILGLLAYAALAGFLMYALRKEKHLQAALIAYLVANIFSFDSFVTYLIFFLLIGFSPHLTHANT